MACALEVIMVTFMTTQSPWQLFWCPFNHCRHFLAASAFMQTFEHTNQ